MHMIVSMGVRGRIVKARSSTQTRPGTVVRWDTRDVLRVFNGFSSLKPPRPLVTNKPGPSKMNQ